MGKTVSEKEDSLMFRLTASGRLSESDAARSFEPQHSSLALIRLFVVPLCLFEHTCATTFTVAKLVDPVRSKSCSRLRTVRILQLRIPRGQQRRLDTTRCPIYQL